MVLLATHAYGLHVTQAIRYLYSELLPGQLLQSLDREHVVQSVSWTEDL